MATTVAQPDVAPLHPTDDAGLLRFFACGSVGDGKSTLIGRLLQATSSIFADQFAALAADSREFGTTGADLDLALLMDGLEAERAQGSTIDVAYRRFATPRRSFIVADAPGQEQYTRSMATAASTSDLALVLVDARKGITIQTRRHAAICGLFGIRHVILAVNKMDLVAYDRATFDTIVAEFTDFAGRLSLARVVAIPISARDGDNVATGSARLPWYDGAPLLTQLETIEVEADRSAQPFRFPVQWVNRQSHDFRGLAGTVVSGSVRTGDEIIVARRGIASRISRIVTADGDLASAGAGEAVTLTLADEVDIVRGDILVHPDHRPQVAGEFAAHVLWLVDEPLAAGRSYLMRIGTQWIPATVTKIQHKLDVDRLESCETRTLALNDIGLCHLSAVSAVAFDAYEENRATGGFILVDRYSYQTAAAGMITVALRRATNIFPEPLAVDKAARASLKRQKPCILWFTGLPAAGKSTIAKLVEAKLHAMGHHTYMLDGDNVRHGLCRDLGFSVDDRFENIRRIGEVAKLFVDAGMIVLCAFISPFRAERQMVREMVAGDEFVEIFIDTPVEECMRRDPKGLYAKARAGTLKNLTGVDSPFEPPEHPNLVLKTMEATAEKLATQVIERLWAARQIHSG